MTLFPGGKRAFIKKLAKKVVPCFRRSGLREDSKNVNWKESKSTPNGKMAGLSDLFIESQRIKDPHDLCAKRIGCSAIHSGELAKEGILNNTFSVHNSSNMRCEWPSVAPNYSEFGDCETVRLQESRVSRRGTHVINDCWPRFTPKMISTGCQVTDEDTLKRFRMQEKGLQVTIEHRIPVPPKLSKKSDVIASAVPALAKAEVKADRIRLAVEATKSTVLETKTNSSDSTNKSSSVERIVCDSRSIEQPIVSTSSTSTRPNTTDKQQSKGSNECASTNNGLQFLFYRRDRVLSPVKREETFRNLHWSNWTKDYNHYRSEIERNGLIRMDVMDLSDSLTSVESFEQKSNEVSKECLLTQREHFARPHQTIMAEDYSSDESDYEDVVLEPESPVAMEKFSMESQYPECDQVSSEFHVKEASFEVLSPQVILEEIALDEASPEIEKAEGTLLPSSAPVAEEKPELDDATYAEEAKVADAIPTVDDHCAPVDECKWSNTMMVIPVWAPHKNGLVTIGLSEQLQKLTPDEVELIDLPKMMDSGITAISIARRLLLGTKSSAAVSMA